MLDAAVDTARNLADALLRQMTALLLLASMLVGEVSALIRCPPTTRAAPTPSR
jgi:hypothetical protein